MMLYTLTLLLIPITTVSGLCTLCTDGDADFDETIDDGLLKAFSDKFELDDNGSGLFDNCEIMGSMVPFFTDDYCSNLHSLGYAFCGCKTPPPETCATGHDGEPIDLDKTLPSDFEFLELGTDSCRDLVAMSGLEIEDDEEEDDEEENDENPFEDPWFITKGVCGGGETCTICPNGFANPDHILEDDDEDEDEDEENSDTEPKTCAEGQAFVDLWAHDDESCKAFKTLLADDGCVCSTSKAQKGTKSSKAPKAAKATKAPKGTKSSKAPKAAKATKGPKGTKSSKAPKAAKATKAPKAAKASKAPKDAEASKAPKGAKLR